MIIYKTVDVDVEVEIEKEDIRELIEEIKLEDEPATNRENDLRTDLYRAIHNGDIDKAREVMALMAMVDIDRELIWGAKK